MLKFLLFLTIFFIVRYFVIKKLSKNFFKTLKNKNFFQIYVYFLKNISFKYGVNKFFRIKECIIYGKKHKKSKWTTIW